MITYTGIISPGMTASADNGGGDWNLLVDGCLMGGQGVRHEIFYNPNNPGLCKKLGPV